MNRAIIIVSGAAFILAASASAFAADLYKPVYKAPLPPAPTPIYSWTGFYVGGNGGYGWNDPSVAFTPNDAAAFGATCGGAFGGTCPPSTSFGINGGFGGLQGGYNWQFSPQWVAGVETDFDWSDIKGTGTSNFNLGGAITPVGPPTAAPSNFMVSQDVKWFGTVRARLGYLPVDRLLVYATGGFAYGRINENVALNSIAGTNIGSGVFDFLCASGPNCFLGNSFRTGTGWTVGGGVEYVLWNNLSVKAEYLFVNLGGGDSISAGASSTTGNNCAPGGISRCTPASFTAAFSGTEFHTVRAGLNWKF
jgi:outer membrane immunogenic protein